MLGYDVDRHALGHPRGGLVIRSVGKRGDIVDAHGHVRDAYDLSPGDGVLVRPDGYIGAIFTAGQATEIERYFADVGLGGRSPL